jgi:pyruvate/2-oxoglutarate dehydrogenase complex dihydrolipoamide dehydrogenase (E3) component
MIVADKSSVEQAIEFDAQLCAVGRKPLNKGYGLEDLL